MEVVNWWHRLVARDLVHWYEQLLKSAAKIKWERDEWQDFYYTSAKDFKQQLEQAISDQAIAVEVIKQCLGAGPVASILNAREHAATQRIKDLERDNIFLLDALQKAKAKLAKFNQR